MIGEKIAAVVVTFHPDERFEDRLAAIAREFETVIVVDNSEDSNVQSHVAATCASQKSEFISNSANLGLAGALNRVFSVLLSRGFTAAVAFDQDSTPHPGFSAALLSAASSESTLGVIGANWQDEAHADITSRYLDRHHIVPFFFERRSTGGDNVFHVTCVITSGSFFSLEIWRTLGGFDESLFLDLVDFDYCLRAGAAGHKVAVASDARLAHRRGDKQPVRLFGRTWWPAFMPPLRLHYLFRNRARLIARHGCHAPHWVVFEFVYVVKILGEILFLEDNKLRKLTACFRGMRDGLLGRSGRLPTIRTR